MKMKQITVGNDYLTDDGEFFKCVESKHVNKCVKCVFNGSACENIACNPEDRDDGKSVIFVK